MARVRQRRWRQQRAAIGPALRARRRLDESKRASARDDRRVVAVDGRRSQAREPRDGGGGGGDGGGGGGGGGDSNNDGSDDYDDDGGGGDGGGGGGGVTHARQESARARSRCRDVDNQKTLECARMQPSDRAICARVLARARACAACLSFCAVASTRRVRARTRRFAICGARPSVIALVGLHSFACTDPFYTQLRRRRRLARSLVRLPSPPLPPLRSSVCTRRGRLHASARVPRRARCEQNRQAECRPRACGARALRFARCTQTALYTRALERSLACSLDARCGAFDQKDSQCRRRRRRPSLSSSSSSSLSARADKRALARQPIDFMIRWNLGDAAQL